MDIQLTNGKVVKSEDLTDKQAEVYEAMYKLYELCKKYDVTVFARAIVAKNKHFSINTIPSTEERKKEEYLYLIELMNEFIKKTTEGQLEVVRIEEE